jgi:chromate transporter
VEVVPEGVSRNAVPGRPPAEQTRGLLGVREEVRSHSAQPAGDPLLAHESALSHTTPRRDLLELVVPFLRLGFTAFGGPAAHIAMMEEEFVSRRGWLTRQHFLDLVGATNLIPGPNSSEMVMHIGYERAGLPGLLLAGACFILPAVACTGALAAFYASYGSLPQLKPWLDGIKPVVVVILAMALLKLTRQAVRGPGLAVLTVLVLAANLAGLPEIPALLAGGLLGGLGRRPWRVSRGGSTMAGSLLMLYLASSASRAWATPPSGGTAVGGATAGGATAGGVAAGGVAAGTVAAGAAQLFLIFLKVGAVLYGSGYVLFAFLEGELVRQRGWLTQAQLLDAIAIGQLTPGPVLSSATFVGFQVAGWQGAVLATVAIFLPSLIFVLGLQRLLPRLRESVWLSAFLDAVNASALALMAAVMLKMALQTMLTPLSWLIAVLAAITMAGLRWPAPYVLLGGAALGWAFAAA